MRKVNRAVKLAMVLLLFALLPAPTIFAEGKSNRDAHTGRTHMQIATGVITPDQAVAISIEEGTNFATFSGLVTIDGPRLYMTVNGNNVSNITKVDDKVWSYSYQLDISAFDVGTYPIVVYAHSYYPNGVPANDIHTLANSITHQLTIFEPEQDVYTYEFVGFELRVFPNNPNQYQVHSVYNEYLNGVLTGEQTTNSHGNINTNFGPNENNNTKFPTINGITYSVTYMIVDGEAVAYWFAL